MDHLASIIDANKRIDQNYDSLYNLKAILILEKWLYVLNTR